jgi:hypothetical protein
MTDEQQLLAALGSAEVSDRYSAMISIGKAGLKQHEKRIAQYLKESEPRLRSAAIRVLAFYWQMPAYRQVAASLMLDPADEVRSVAVMSWASYDTHKRDPDTLRSLYRIIVDDNESRRVRDSAYTSFFSVYLPTNAGFPKPALQLDKTIEECVDWKRLDAAIEDSGAWRPSGPSLQEVTQLTCTTGTVTLVLTRDLLEVTRGGDFQRGPLQPKAWIRALGAFELGGFPTSPAGRDGEQIALAWTRNRIIEQVSVPSAPVKYRDIIRVSRELAATELEISDTQSPSGTVIATIEYRRGDRGALYGGCTQLTVHSSERFELFHERRDERRSWAGTLRAGTFDRAVALIRAAGFPNAPALTDLVPGEQTGSIAIERGGVWQRIDVSEKDSRYFELVRLVSSIVAPLDESLAHMPPGATSPVDDAHAE